MMERAFGPRSYAAWNGRSAASRLAALPYCDPVAALPFVKSETTKPRSVMRRASAYVKDAPTWRPSKK